MLQIGCLRRIDPHVGERAEAGGDPVDDVTRLDRLLDHATRGVDACTRRSREGHIGARRDRGHVGQRERLSDRDRHGCEGYYRTRTL
jgi:hypothetical protein